MTELQLSEKVIFITGVAGLLGKASAKMFLNRGGIVIGSDIVTPNEFSELTEIQNKFGPGRFNYIPADVSKEKEVQKVIFWIQKQFGRLDGVFHNAFKQARKPVEDLSLDEWNNAINGTLTSTFIVNKHAVSSMIESGGGSIVNTSSIIAQVPKVNNAAYGAAKAGIHQFTKTVALENGKRDIRANVLVAGSFRSREALSQMEPKEKKAFQDRYLLGRTGKAEELSEVAAFLLSDAASYITASLINTDGGYRLTNRGYR